MLSNLVQGALVGLAFGYFEQSISDSRDRHMFKYAVFGGLGFAVLASLRSQQAPSELHAAIAHRQQGCGLPATGVVDRATMECLVLG